MSTKKERVRTPAEWEAHKQRQRRISERGDFNGAAGSVIGGRKDNTLSDFKQKLADYCRKKGIFSLNRRDRSRLFRQRQALALAGEQGAP